MIFTRVRNGSVTRLKRAKNESNNRIINSWKSNETGERNGIY